MLNLDDTLPFYDFHFINYLYTQPTYGYIL